MSWPGKGLEFTGPVEDRVIGPVAAFGIPGGFALHLYQPKHPTAMR
jgi:hypothetical protein